MRGPALPPAFRRLWYAHTVSSVGDAMTATTMILWAYRVGGDRAGLVSATVIACFLPPVVVGLTMGGLADRYDRRRVMVAADVIRLVLGVGLAFCAHRGFTAGALGCLGLMTGAGALFSAAQRAAIPHLVAGAQLARANGVMSVTKQVSFVVGSPLAAVLIGVLGPVPAVLVDAATFAVSAALLVGLRLPARTPAPAGSAPAGSAPAGSAPAGSGPAGSAPAGRDPEPRGSLRPALRAILARPSVRASTAAAILLAVSAGTNNTIMVMFIDHDLGGRDADIGWLSAANGVAQMVAGGAVVAVAGRLPLHRSIAAAVAAMAVFSGLLAASPVVIVAIAAVVVVALANAPFSIAYTTVCQTEVADAVVARVFAVSGGLSSGAFLLGSFGGALLADRAGARLGIAASAACLAVAAVIVAPLWRRTAVPRVPEPADPIAA